MAGRTRTTKKLAQRIDLQYFTRPHPFRRWKFWMSVGAPALVLLWVIWLGVSGTRSVFSSGSMATPHALFGAQCAACHVAEAEAFARNVSDTACLACHDGPLHNEKQLFTPSCGSCHADHRGTVRLADVNDASCIQCHADLQGRAAVNFARNITGFTGTHPEFAAVREGSKDTGAIKLNHMVHLKPGLRGPAGSGLTVRLVCSDCHRVPAVEQPWRFGTHESRRVAEKKDSPDPLEPAATRAYMGPISYAKQCAACHTLEFDKRFTEQVPHDKPEIVVEYVVAKYRDYIARHPEEVRRVVRFERQLTGEPPRVLGPARNAEEWVKWQVEEAERLLWRKTCHQCHTLQFEGSSQRDSFAAVIPAVVKPNIKPVWMPHAKFNHEPHRMLECSSCHAQAPTSQETSDILLPPIATCRTCHTSRQASAGDGCYVCHSYHDWSKRKEVNGRYTIPGLVHGRTQTE